MRLIDADALKEKIQECTNCIIASSPFMIGLESGYESAEYWVDEAPTVEERKQGHWLTKKAWHVECSECHHVLEFICDVKKYCSNCGAKMDGESNE